MCTWSGDQEDPEQLDQTSRDKDGDISLELARDGNEPGGCDGRSALKFKGQEPEPPGHALVAFRFMEQRPYAQWLTGAVRSPASHSSRQLVNEKPARARPAAKVLAADGHQRLAWMGGNGPW